MYVILNVYVRRSGRASTLYYSKGRAASQVREGEKNGWYVPV